VPVHPPRSGLVHEHVCERVREVAGQGDEPVVGVGVDRHGPRAEAGHEGVQAPMAACVRDRDRCQKPGCAGEEVGAGVADAAGLRPAHGVAADEAPVLAGGGHEPRLRRADIRHRAAVRGGLERARHQLGQPGDRPADDGDLGAGDRGIERILDAGGRSALEPGRSRVRVGIERDHLVAAGGGGEADRAADQAEADDGDAHQVTPPTGGATVRMSSASRKARSSDWRAFRRGSHRVW
jgi:hypothetical protein